MSKNRAMSLSDWCVKHNRSDLLAEWWKEDVVNQNPNVADVSSVRYNHPVYGSWVCASGHHYRMPLVRRTLFGQGCPVCDSSNKYLPIGFHYGCLTIVENLTELMISDIKARQKLFVDGEAFVSVIPKEHHSVKGVSELEYALKIMKVRKLYEEGKRDVKPPFPVLADDFNFIIGQYERVGLYKVRCKCGREFCLNGFYFEQKRHRWCCDDCALRKQIRQTQFDNLKVRRESYPRKFVDGYDVDLTGQVHETLCVVERVDDLELLCVSKSHGHETGGRYDVFARYRCFCEFCGKEHIFKHTDFIISPPTAYGLHAYNGYWCNAKCDCHPISSFQWITTKLLKDHNVLYRAEVYFPGLYGFYQQNVLRFDFCVFNGDGTVKCLIECQGEQHFEAVDEFGGKDKLFVQQQNDAIKRIFCEQHGLRLIEIMRVKCNLFEHVETVLHTENII